MSLEPEERIFGDLESQNSIIEPLEGYQFTKLEKCSICNKKSLDYIDDEESIDLVKIESLNIT